MEDLFYAIGILISGAFVFHFALQFSFTIWLVYFIVAQMWPILFRIYDPRPPARLPVYETRYDENYDPPVVTILKPQADDTGPGPTAWLVTMHQAWRASPTAMTIVSCIYLVMCLLLIIWCSIIFGMVVRLGDGRRGRAIRTVLSHVANKLATPAFASAIMLAGYLCWGCWIWWSSCKPGTNLGAINLANAVVLTVPNALFTILWVIASACELAWFIRRPRPLQDDLPGPNLAVPAGGAQLNPAPAVAVGGGGGGGGRRRGRSWSNVGVVVDILFDVLDIALDIADAFGR